ncbi:hypothetical protein HK101_001347, partial [Irineochytrium annulatum]
EIRVDSNTGKYYEVSKDGEATLLETASITLNDCLACSGCVTSAESILVSSQSHHDLYKVLSDNAALKASNQDHLTKTVVVSLSPQSRASFAAKYNVTIESVHRRLVKFLSALGIHHVIDAAFARDFSLLESAREFVRRYREREFAGTSEGILPMLASWICYAEKTYGHILPYISTTKSPQQIMGSIVKSYLGGRLALDPDKIYHISVMPCYDKKLEASRSDFYNDVYRTRDVDTVLTTGELERVLKEHNTTLSDLPEGDLPELFTKAGPSSHGLPVLYGSEGSSSGGYLSYIFRYAAKELFGVVLSPSDVEHGSNNVHIRAGRNPDYYDVILIVDGKEVLKFAAAYGFRNIQNLVRKVKRPNAAGGGPIRGRGARLAGASAAPDHDFVEIMACPSGCINGGGQLKPENLAGGDKTPVSKAFIAVAEAAYRSVSRDQGVQFPEESADVARLYRCVVW